MLKFEKIIAALLCCGMVFSFTGCKKNVSEDSEYSVIYEYINSSKNENSEDRNNSESSQQQDSSGSTGSTTSQSGASGSGNKPYVDNSSRLKDLKGREIVCILPWDATDRTSDNGKALTKTERMLNCKFVERKTTSYNSFYASILSGAPMADIFYPKDKTVLNMAYNNMLTPLDTLSNFNFKDDCWDQQALKDSSLNGHIYGMNRGRQWREILFYNKDMFASNNWPDLYELQSAGKLDWDRLYEIMKKAVQVNNAGKVSRYGLVPLYSLAEFGSSLLVANGAHSITRVGDTVNFKNNFTTNEATLNALNTLVKWCNEPGILYDSSQAGWDSGRQIFYSGKAAMAIIDYDMLGTIDSNADFNWGAVLFPHGPNTKQDFLIHNTAVACIPAGVKNANDIALFWDILQDNQNYDFSEKYTGKDYDSTFYNTLNRYFKEVQEGKCSYDWGRNISVGGQLDDVARGKTTPASAIASVKQTIDSDIKKFLG